MGLNVANRSGNVCYLGKRRGCDSRGHWCVIYLNDNLSNNFIILLQPDNRENHSDLMLTGLYKFEKIIWYMHSLSHNHKVL